MSAARLGRGLLAPSLALLGLAPLAYITAVAQAQPAAGTLESCVPIADPTQRLACYDALAHRVTTAAPAPNGAASQPAAPPAAAAAVAAPATPALSAPQLPAAAGAPAPVSTPATAASAPGAPAAPALSPQQAFGLYRAEHPSSVELQSLTARVTGVHTSARGRPVVDLEGGQAWELDAADPLLAAGDMVTIRRASLGSFILTTPTRRVHRAYRLN